MSDSKPDLAQLIGGLESTLSLAESALKNAEFAVIRALGKLVGSTVCIFVGLWGAFIEPFMLQSIFIGVVGLILYGVVHRQLRTLEAAVKSHQQTVANRRGQLAQAKAQLHLP